MKPFFYYLPEICIVLAGIVSGLCFIRFNTSNAHQVLTYLALFVLLVIMRIARKSETSAVPAKPVIPTLENPREFKRAFDMFCEDELTNFRRIRPALTAKGAMSEPPDTNLARPTDIDLYFEAIDSLEEIGEDISKFVTEILACEITSRRTLGIVQNSAIVIETSRAERLGSYVFVVSPAKVKYHYRIQVGLVLPC